MAVLSLMTQSRRAVLAVGLTAVMCLAACSPDPPDATASPDHAEESPSAPNGTTLSGPSSSEAHIDDLLPALAPVPPIRENDVSLFEGAYEWEFPNGTLVVFVPSDIDPGYVDMSAQSLGGWSLLPEGSASLDHAITNAVTHSVMGYFNGWEFDRRSFTSARVRPYLDELTESFAGYAKAGDLDDLLALMHLYITDPRVTEFAAAEQMQVLHEHRDDYENKPHWTAPVDSDSVRYRHSPWYQAILTREEIEAVTADRLLELYEARFSDVDDLMVVIVGDIDRETVASLAIRYIGTLPAGEPDRHVNHDPGFPQGIQRIAIPMDPEDHWKSVLRVWFDADVPITGRTMVIADLMSTLLDRVLEDAVREELGEAKTVGASLWPLIEVGTWDTSIGANVPSESFEQAKSTIIETVAELAGKGFAESDLARAKSKLRDRYQLSINSEIIEPLLRRRHLDDALVGTPEQRLAILDEIAAADIQHYLPLFFDPDNRIELYLGAE